MGFLDKVKAQAEQVATKAQQGMAQGQAKLDEMQAKKQADAILRDLGAAYYAEQRSGGSHSAVDVLLAKLDEHTATHGAIDTAPTAPSPSSPSVPPPAGAEPGQPTPPAAETPSASYSLDDL
jgi:hypothetical protein